MEKVELAEYDPAWIERFEAEAVFIRDALGHLVREIEHVGSTAVPGLAGKPTIDIAVGVDAIELPPDRIAEMAARGFRQQIDDERPWERRFVKGSAFPRGPNWRSYLRFRDALRGDKLLAAEYEQLKRSLLERGRWYRGVDKQELIERVLER